jgi:hypothetical protein
VSYREVWDVVVVHENMTSIASVVGRRPSTLDFRGLVLLNPSHTHLELQNFLPIET